MPASSWDLLLNISILYLITKKKKRYVKKQKVLFVMKHYVNNIYIF